MNNAFDRLFELLKSPRDIDVFEMKLIFAGFAMNYDCNLLRRCFTSNATSIDIFTQITGKSKSESKRSNYSISRYFNTPNEFIKFGVLKLSKKEFEPFFVLDNSEDRIFLIEEVDERILWKVS